MAGRNSIEVIPGTSGARRYSNGSTRNYRNYNSSGRGSRPSGSRNRRRRKQQRMRRLVRRLVFTFIFALIVLGVAMVLLEKNRVYKVVEAEAGSQLTVSDFLGTSDKNAYFTEDSDDIVTGDSFVANKVGDFTIAIKSGLFVHKSTLRVVDTVAPEFTVKDLDTCVNSSDSKINAQDFVVDAKDATKVVYQFETEPDCSSEGTQDVTIIGTDEGGNKTSHDAKLKLTYDDVAPTISGQDFEVYIGDTIAYKSYVTVSDNLDGELDIQVDNSQVDTEKEGTYQVNYTVTDRAGNSASTSVNMTVKAHAYSEQKLYELCDEILAEIITSDMSKEKQCIAIYNWEHEHIGYVNSSEKGDWVKAAYEGITTRGGDCYVYASVSKALLTRAGITNMDIERIPEGDKMHYWNLVDLEDGHGWYHFDATPRVGRPYLCLLNDAELKEYSDAHDNCHNYDRSKYPDIP